GNGCGHAARCRRATVACHLLRPRQQLQWKDIHPALRCGLRHWWGVDHDEGRFTGRRARHLEGARRADPAPPVRQRHGRSLRPATGQLRARPLTVKALWVLLVCAAPAAGQTVEYRDYTSQRDTGGVARAESALVKDPKNLALIARLGAA